MYESGPRKDSVVEPIPMDQLLTGDMTLILLYVSQEMVLLQKTESDNRCLHTSRLRSSDKHTNWTERLRSFLHRY